MKYFAQTYEEFLSIGGNSPESLFFIIEYNPNSYDNPADRYSLMRTEILNHSQDYVDRLNNGIYRVWTKTPIELEW